MKRLLLTCVAVVGLAGTASAQYGGGGYGGGGYGGGGYGGGGYGGGGYGPPPGPGYGPPPGPGYGPPRGGGYGGPGYGGGYGPPPRRASTVCVTSRGSCPIGYVVPRNTPCGCEVPGFGYKRGAAG